MTHNKLDYIELLQQNGYRVTRQRESVLDAVCQANGHATLSEIYYRSKKLDASIHRSTVYRCLDLFVKLGLTIVGTDAGGERTFELVKEKHHHHLICSSCRHEVEIDDDLVDDFYRQLRAEYHYRVGMDHLIVFGLCSDCSPDSI